MIKKLLLLMFLITSLVQAQQETKWVDITDHDLKFKLPEGYKLKNVQGIKTYVYQSSNKIISILILKEDKAINNLDSYYQGLIKGFTPKANETIANETYKIQDYLVAKNIQKVTYEYNVQNYIESHIIYLKGNTYLARFEYPTNPLDKIVEDKDILFSSLKL